MSLPIVESLSGLWESIFSLFRVLQLKSHKKNKKMSNFIKLSPLPLLANGCVGSLGLLLEVLGSQFSQLAGYI